MQIRNKDFLETAEGLVFAVLADVVEEGRHPCFLRYLRTECGFRKLSTGEAERLVSQSYPQYRFHSVRRDVLLHGVRDSDITRHHSSRAALKTILRCAQRDPIQNEAVEVLQFIERRGLATTAFGITGSLLIGAQKAGSDIDLLLYDRGHFNTLRTILRQALPENRIGPLNMAQWRASYERRGCSLSLEEYIWHERRKYNKVMIADTKVDFTLITEADALEFPLYRKIGAAEIVAPVRDDRRAFDTPATYGIAHPEVTEILSFTQTFAGQAFKGETVVARGMLEESSSGRRRLVIGSSREAPGEYLKIMRN